MEFLSILYALLASLTGLSVGDVAVVRQPVVVSAAVTATATVTVARKVPAAIYELGRRAGRAARRPRNDRPSASHFIGAAQLSVLYFARRHE